MPKLRYIFPITPQTNVRATQGDKVFFRIPRDKLKPAGLKRLMRLERYNAYKVAVNVLAKERHFSLPPQGASIRFYIPLPPSWSKKKKALFHLKLHQAKPDLDNLIKALKDSLFMEDKHIAHYEAAKFWVDNEEGWIEIILNDPLLPSVDGPAPKESV